MKQLLKDTNTFFEELLQDLPKEMREMIRESSRR